ncbi:MAG: hypothetical protein U5L72_19870 [Bacteroidales bacterium]|nr:hypothetical protein [Bacteroidales bacterium]
MNITIVITFLISLLFLTSNLISCLTSFETYQRRIFPELVTSDSPTMRVGSDLTEEFIQAEHTWPMLSLGNTYSAAEVAEFGDRVRRTLGI